VRRVESHPGDTAFARRMVAAMAKACPNLASVLTDRPWRIIRIPEVDWGFTSFSREEDVRTLWSLNLM
jgi:hypothetical protein